MASPPPSGKSSSPSFLLICLRQIFYLFLAFVSVFLILEGVLQIISPQKIFPDLHVPAFHLPFVLKTNLNIKIGYFDGYDYPPFQVKTNANHMRNNGDFSYKKPPNTYRILILGNSVFMGLGVNNNELFSSYLETILNENAQGKRFEVLNFSGIAWGPTEYYIYLKNEGYKFDPDLIIMSKGENDFRKPYTEEFSFKNIIREEEIESNKVNLSGLTANLKNGSILNQVWNLIRRMPFYMELSGWSQSIYKVRQRMNSIWNRRIKNTNTRISLHDYFKDHNIWIQPNTTFILGQNKFHVNIKGHSITFFSHFYKSNRHDAEANIVLYSAVLYQLMDLISQMNAKLLVVDIPSNLEVIGTVKQNKNLNGWIFPGKNNVFYLNLIKPLSEAQKKFPDTPLYYLKNNHWTPAGHRLSAAVVFNYLVQNKVLPGFPKSQVLIDHSNSQIQQTILKSNERIAQDLKDSPDIWFFKGLINYSIKQFSLAKRFLSRYLEINPGNHETHYYLGLAHFRLKEFPQATQHFKFALNGHPLERQKYEYAYRYSKTMGKIWLYFERGQYNDALGFFSELENLGGMWETQTYYIKALTYKRLGNLKEAEAACKIALQLEEDSPESRFLLLQLLSEILYSARHYQEALEAARKAEALHSNIPYLKLVKALSYLSLGNLEKALMNFKEKYQLKPDAPTQKIIKDLEDELQTSLNRSINP